MKNHCYVESVINSSTIVYNKYKFLKHYCVWKCYIRITCYDKFDQVTISNLIIINKFWIKKVTSQLAQIFLFEILLVFINSYTCDHFATIKESKYFDTMKNKVQYELTTWI